MARQQKALPVLSAAEKKEAKAGLKLALQNVNTEHGKFVSDHKSAVKAHATLVKETTKSTTVSLKAVELANKKLEKASASATVGREKIAAKLAALEPVAAKEVETA
jgi:hypothetical protein